MATAVVEPVALIPASLYARLKHEATLAAFRQELAGLRFSIVLLARWESSDNLDACNRGELREELAHLRALYLDTLDELAMTFGVQQAIEMKQEVERSIEVPRDMMPPIAACEEDEQRYF
jgi:hypothetical protein